MQKTMYPAVNNSPQTSLSAQIGAADATIPVVNSSFLPSAPNEATIGDDESAEVVLYTGKSGNSLTGCTRGFNGTTAKGWASGTAVQRAFTAYDHDAFKANIEDVDARVQTLELYKDANVYGVLWDGVNASCKRLYNAFGITTDTTHFAHRGSVDAQYANPFDSIYPWSDRRLCNVDLTAYQALAPGADVKDCIAAWFGDPDFAWDGSNGPVMVYTPEFWTHLAETEEGIIFAIAGAAVDGWTHVEEYIGGRWFCADDDAGGITSKPGMPKLNTSMNSLHNKAKAKGMTLDNIYTWAADSILQVVEYASMNTQNNVGKGDSSSFCRSGTDLCTVAQTAENSVIVSNTTAAIFASRIGCILDIGRSIGSDNVGRRVLVSVDSIVGDDANKKLTFSGAVLTTAVGNFVSAHGIINTEDSDLGEASGYLGTNGYCHAYYRGAISHAGRWRYVLGAYRQENTGHIWIAPTRATCDDYDYLNTGSHQDTGFVLPQASGGAACSGYIKKLYHLPEIPLAPFPEERGGSSDKPVCDLVNIPNIAHVSSSLLTGGSADLDLICGRFCTNWAGIPSNGGWYYSGVPFLKTP